VIQHAYRPAPGSGGGGDGTVKRPAPRPKVRVVRPRGRAVPGGTRLKIVWKRSGQRGDYAELKYAVGHGGRRVIARRTRDDGRFTWWASRKLEDRWVRVKVVVHRDGKRGLDVSRWFRVR
jgi:hypothetical protein